MNIENREEEKQRVKAFLNNWDLDNSNAESTQKYNELLDSLWKYDLASCESCGIVGDDEDEVYEREREVFYSAYDSECDDDRYYNYFFMGVLCDECHRYEVKKEADDASSSWEEEEKANGYVYFCHDGQYIKIGQTKKYPDKRVINLSTSYHKKFELLGYIYTEFFKQKEKLIHGILRNKRVCGEWFDVSFEELKVVLQQHNFTYKTL